MIRALLSPEENWENILTEVQALGSGSCREVMFHEYFIVQSIKSGFIYSCKYLTVSSSTISSGETPPKKMPSKVSGNKRTYKVAIMLLKLCDFNINMGR